MILNISQVAPALAEAPAAPATVSLDELPLGQWAEIQSVDRPPGEAHWLGALGLAPGQRLAVLRRALWGGPLHVRTERTGDLAVDRALARSVRVVPGSR